METTLLEQSDLHRRISRAYVNLKKLGAARISQSEVQTRLDVLEVNWNTFRANHRTLLPLGTKQPLPEYFEQDVYLLTEEKYIQVRTSFASELEKLRANDPKPQISQPENSNSCTHSRQSTLKQIDLPTFSGQYKEWTRFSELYTALVLEDSTFSKVEKMHYLVRHLAGEAASFVSDTKLSGTNLDDIWARLRQRYENLRLLVNSQLQVLTSIAPMNRNSSAELKRVLDGTCNVVAALEGLDRPLLHESSCGHNDLLVFLTVKKLDLHNLKEWETLIGASKEPATFEQLTSFLQTRIQVQEAIEAQTAPAPLHGHRDVISRSGQSKGARTHHLSSEGKPKTTKQCAVCHDNHFILYCRAFNDKTADQRYDFVTSNQLCLNCLGRHSSKDCRSPKRCQRCTGKHHTSLHDVAADRMHQTAIPTASRSSHATSTLHHDYMVTLLATARVKVARSPGNYETVRALIDPCSEISLVAESLVQRLRLHRQTARIPITGVGENTSVMCRGKVQLQFASIINADSLHQVSAYVLSKLSSYRPRCRAFRSDWPHLAGLRLADPQYYSSDAIEILLGADVYGSLIREGLRLGDPMMPIAQCTSLGWILTGSTSNTPRDSQPRVALQCSIDRQLLSMLERFWEQEEKPQEGLALSEEERECEEHFQRTFQRLPSGRFLLRLPFKTSPEVLGATRPNALRSLNSMETRFRRTPSFQASYSTFMEEYLQLGHMGLTSPPTPNQAHVYLPHHGVLKSDGSSTKFRVVFNGSARSSTNISLNDLLHSGPRLQPDLSTIISRWRCHRYGLCADIEKMYRQILIHKDDRTFQRILWRSRSESSIQEYCLNTVTYGLSCAPYLALRTLKQLAQDEAARFPIGSRILLTSTYVDDILTGADSPQELCEVQKQLTGLCMAGGFPLAKWCSNLPEFVTTMTSLQLSEKNLLSSQPGVLGLRWSLQTDCLSVGNRITALPPLLTKRVVLGQIAQIFDPLGWLSPFVSAAKIFMQSLWLLSIDWDEELPRKSKETWCSYLQDWDSLGKIQIPRWIGVTNDSSVLDLHGFCDASERAYAAVIYLRKSSRDTTVQISLLTAKSKVAPLKQVSLPRLELCGASLLVSLAAHFIQATGLHIRQVNLWTDSTITLAWIQGHPSRWKTFVANRVSSIQTTIPGARWRHVPGSCNPADCASRGIGPKELASHPLWWQGPTWLTLAETAWPSPSSIVDLSSGLEARHSHHLNASTDEELWDLAHRYSSWTRLIRITAWCQRWRTSHLTRRNQQSLPANLTTTDLTKAQEYWVAAVQSCTFSAELQALRSDLPVQSKSPLIKLHPFVDKRGLLRLGGRLSHSILPYDAKHPLILPRASPITSLIIAHYHARQLHGGVQSTLAALRLRFWILQGRREVKAYIHGCLKCLKWRAKTATQLMGDLPVQRTRPSRPFTHVGVDYAGPINFKLHHGRGRRSQKGFIAIFVCHSTRAVHLELVSDYSTQAFLAAFKRLVARRGICVSITSDCGTNFIGADAELRRLFRASSATSHDIVTILAKEGTTWSFNPPAAPHMNGLAEAAVKSVKLHIRRVLGDALLTFEELTTFLTQVEACLNSRPLTAISDDPDDLDPLTPGHFLIGQPLTLVPEPNLTEVPINRLSRWQLTRQLTEHFWNRWSQEYIHSLQPRGKWTTIQRNLQVGDLCLIRSEITPPSKWPLGRITQLFPGSDGCVRVAELKTQRSHLKRPISKLVVVLPCDPPTS